MDTHMTKRRIAAEVFFIIATAVLMILVLYSPTSSHSAAWAETTYTWERYATSYSANNTYSNYTNIISPHDGMVEFRTTVDESSADGKQNYIIFTITCEAPPEKIDAGKDVSLNLSLKANIIKRERTNYPMADCKLICSDPELGTDVKNTGSSWASYFLGYQNYGDQEYTVTDTMPDSTTVGEKKSIYFIGTAGYYEWRYRLVKHSSGSDGDNDTASSDTDYVLKGNLVYAVKNGKATFFYRKNDKLTKITIPATIKYKGKKIPVTVVEKEAFKGMKNLKTVIIGKNVKKIGKNAFRNCPKLKNITIKTKSLTAKRVGANAFKGINKKAIIKCPEAKKAAYKKTLLKRGMKKTVKFRNI